MRGEVKENVKNELAQEGADVSVEKQQEILLMNKLASTGKLPPKSASNFLQKKLQQRKFFDSGDYAMNQQSKDKKILPPMMTLPTNDEIEKDIQKPIEIETEKHEPLSAPTAGAITINSSSIPEADDSDDESHLQIPRPDTVPQRKSSILHPSVHSKLSPTPLIHREHTDESVNCHHTLPPQ